MIFKKDPESIEWFIENQDFLPSYDLAPPPLPLASCLPNSLFLSIAGRAYWRERGGGGTKPYHGEKAWSSINHSILSGHTWAHWWDLAATRPELDGAATPGSSSRRSHQTQYFAYQRPSVLLDEKVSVFLTQTSSTASLILTALLMYQKKLIAFNKNN